MIKTKGRWILLICWLLIISSCAKKEENRPLRWGMIFSMGDQKAVDEITDELEKKINELSIAEDFPIEIIGVSLESEDLTFEAYMEQADLDAFDILSIPEESLSFRGKTVYTNPYSYVCTHEIFHDLTSFMKSEMGQSIVASIGEGSVEASKWNHRVYGLSAPPVLFAATSYQVEDLEAMGIDKAKIKPGLFNNKEWMIAYMENDQIPIGMFNPQVLDELGLFYFPFSTLIVFDGTAFQSVLEVAEFREEMTRRMEFKNLGLIDLNPVPETEYLASTYPFPYLSDQPSQVGERYIVPSKPVLQPRYGDAKTGIIHKKEIHPKAYEVLTALFTHPGMADVFASKDLTEENAQDYLKYYVASWGNSLQREDQDKSRLQIKEDVWMQSSDIPVGFRFDPTPVWTEILHTNMLYNPHQIIWDESIKPEEPIGEKILHLQSTDLLADLDTLEKELNRAGLQKILDEVNRQYQEWRADDEN